MTDSYIVGDAEVIQRFGALDGRLKAELRVGIGRLALKLARNIHDGKLNGQVLKRRSGHLQDAITDFLTDAGDTISGGATLSTPIPYAKAHEYGFTGVVTVKQHMRTIKQAFGRAISPRQVNVRLHSMRMNLPERSFMRSALRDMEQAGEIGAEMAAAVKRAIS